jgi:hypothetical protein
MGEHPELGIPERGGWTSDPAERAARARLRQVFDAERDRVFFPRQLAVRFEGNFFHWVTARAIRNLVAAGDIISDVRSLPSASGKIHILRHRSFRYYRRAADQLVRLVNEYAHPNVGGAIGVHGEGMVLGGFAHCEFVMKGRETRRFRDREWVETNHDLDFIFERDRLAYGIEVKNTLAYPDQREFRTKIRMAKFLGLVPVFVARMLPKTWIFELFKAGGFALILKYQLYPYSHRDLAERVATALELPVGAPRRLNDGTVARFLKWHLRRVKKRRKSHKQ